MKFKWPWSKKEETVINLCVNCKFCEETDGIYKRCYRFPLRPDPVTGRQDFFPCSSVRDGDWMCGYKGKFFEKKPTWPN